MCRKNQETRVPLLTTIQLSWPRGRRTDRSHIVATPRLVLAHGRRNACSHIVATPRLALAQSPQVTSHAHTARGSVIWARIYR
jgi:hypothetical protein